MCGSWIIKLVSSSVYTVYFVMSVRPLKQLSSHWTDYHAMVNLSIFQKPVKKIEVTLKIDKNNGYFTWRPIFFFWSYPTQVFLEWEMFQTKAVEKIKTHFVFFFF